MTRKEAIDIIRSIYHTNTELEALAILVPELRESEDERIRKELKEAFEVYDIESKWNGIPIRSIFAWLEKQKERKTAEWSEEDEEMLNSCISSIEEAKENRYAYKETDGDTSYDHEIDWLKSLPERFNPQPNIEICPHSIKSKSYKEKPAECIEDSIEFKEGFKTGRESGLRDGVKYVLDNLEDYGLCKQAEWSEDLLEWAKKKFNEVEIAMETGADDPALWGERNAFKQVIDKLNSMKNEQLG